jgi:CO/xanthine dehydrogenase Mo-binding subunit
MAAANLQTKSAKFNGEAQFVMRQNKTKIEPSMESVIQVKLPMVRDFSTGGGHAPGDELVEGDAKIVTKKWQGYPPANLNVVGKPMPPMPEVAIPRFTGKAEYATRVSLPNMLQARFLTSPYPRARIRSLDATLAEKMPGVRFILTYQNSLKTSPLPQNLNFQGEVVAIVAADTEDQADDAIEAIKVDYEVLPSASSLNEVMAPNAPDLRDGKGNLITLNASSQHYAPNASWTAKHGDVNAGFAEADVVKEFTYYFAGATPIPIQPFSSVAKWDGDKLTFWGHGQSIYPARAQLARGLGIDVSMIRYIDKYNGCTFGPGNTSARFDPSIAYISKMTGRPVKLMLPKDQELGFLTIKPENIQKFKVGAKKDGKIVAIIHEVYSAGGDSEGGGLATSANARHNHALYSAHVPHWQETFYNYKTNSIRFGCVRSCTQQEVKWGWENMIDEMAEALGLDPIKFRLMNVAKPGSTLTPEWSDLYKDAIELENGTVHFDSYASVEVLEEGAKAIGWAQRNATPGGAPGRFKRGIGLGMSSHHPGHMGYHDGEVGFERYMAQNGGGGFGAFGAELELAADGNIIMRNALPDSGTNHDTALAHLVAEMLGFTTRDRIRVIWGDSDTAPSSGQWLAGKTITIQGAAVCAAADKLKKDLLNRASQSLKIDVANLRIRDGVISAADDQRKRVSFVELVRANRGSIKQTGRGVSLSTGRALTRGVGACYVEVEVDTWTGHWRFLKSVYSHDVGLVVNPLVSEADMHGSLVESMQMTTDPIPWDREFPGTRHYSVGYLSYRLPTIMDVPETQTQIFIDSLEPRWFFGIKSFSETTIGAVPGAISNAIYNATGVRVREHPITRDKIMAGLKARRT